MPAIGSVITPPLAYPAAAEAMAEATRFGLLAAHEAGRSYRWLK